MIREVCAVLVLALVAGVARADEPESFRCIKECLHEEVPTPRRFARSPLSTKVFRFSRSIAPIEDSGCERVVHCLKSCSSSSVDRLVLQVSQILARKCDTFRKGHIVATSEAGRFMKNWLSSAEQTCVEPSSVAELDEFCRVSTDCVFGKALDATKSGYDADVVALVVALFKFGYVQYAEDNFGDLLSR
ncbi:hypothetical protein AAVH_29713 [Aphelenchoides avenae]|nr:hypothetical protein AAVH_29713 [Aphelenchus avenae]